MIIGNPPYVEYSKVRDSYTVRGYETIESGNLYSYVFERSAQLVKSGGRIGLIVPLGGFATARMEPYRRLLASRFDQLHISYYSGDAHPSVMFAGVKYRLSIVLARSRRTEVPRVFVTKYMRWYADERDDLFEKLVYTLCPFSEGHFRFAKLENGTATSVLHKILASKPQLGYFVNTGGSSEIHYHRSPVFWIRAMDFDPYFNSATRSRSEDHIRDLAFGNDVDSTSIGAILNSSTFFHWFIAQGNCRDLANPDVLEYPAGTLDPELAEHLTSVFGGLMQDLQLNSRRRVYVYKTSGRVEYDEFYPRLSKTVIDQIDRVLAKHYRFTDEELDFIINYDIKYRMGLDGDSEAA